MYYLRKYKWWLIVAAFVLDFGVSLALLFWFPSLMLEYAVR